MVTLDYERQEYDPNLKGSSHTIERRRHLVLNGFDSFQISPHRLEIFVAQVRISVLDWHRWQKFSIACIALVVSSAHRVNEHLFRPLTKPRLFIGR